MSKKNRDIKPTRDGRFHAMGLVVDTFDEAFDRCLEKTKAAADDWCTLVTFENYPLGYKNLEASMYIPGNREFLRQCLPTEPSL